MTFIIFRNLLTILQNHKQIIQKLFSRFPLFTHLEKSIHSELTVKLYYYYYYYFIIYIYNFSGFYSAKLGYKKILPKHVFLHITPLLILSLLGVEFR